MKSYFLHNAFAVARNTFSETIRDKVLYAIIAFAFIFITFTLFLGSISLGENIHVIRSLGMAGVYLFGLIITIFLGASLLYKELEKKTLYFILSKPITHTELLLGKFFGLFSSVGVSMLGMSLVYLAVVRFEGGGFDALGLLALLYAIAEMGVLVALLIFFSTYARPLAAAVYALVVLYIGHSLGLLLTAVKSGAMVYLVRALYYVLPNLEKFNLRELALYQVSPTPQGVLWVVVYACLYIALLLWGASLLLQRREL